MEFQRRRWLVARVTVWLLAVVGALGLLGVMLWAIWRVPPAWYAYVPDPTSRANAEASTRTGMIAGLAALAALGSLVLTTRTYLLTQQSQLTDRYTKAIAQLGDDKVDIRLGGIYALERIAVDSRRDHPTVVEVLSTFARERSGAIRMVRPANRRTAHPPTLWQKQVKLGVDVQAAITVLGRLPRRAGVSRGDLRRANLVGATLTHACLTRARFDEADLTDARLDQADLGGASLARTNLTRADLFKTNLTGTDLSETDLTQADFFMANLTRAWLAKANVTETDFASVNLKGAYLGEVDLTAAKHLTQQRIEAASGDEDTKLPPNLQRPARWPRR